MMKRIIAGVCRECKKIIPVKELKETIVDKKRMDIMLKYLICPNCTGKEFNLISYEVEK